MSGATIKVMYFARIAELTGQRQEDWPLAAATSCDAWLAALEARYPQLAPIRRLKVAVNQHYAGPSALIQPGDEVAVFEPVTGG